MIGRPMPNPAPLTVPPLYLHPYHYPDELHASQAGRYHTHSANRTTVESYLQLYQSPPFRVTHVVPPNLEQWALRLGGNAKENLAYLLKETTLFPLFHLFRESHVDLNGNFDALRGQLRRLPKRVVGQSGAIKLCWECLRADKERFGEPYIHRSHQIPGCNVCWLHGTELLTRCPFCRDPFESAKHGDLITGLWSRCDCGYYLPEEPSQSPLVTDERELRYARFGYEILNGPVKHLAPYHLTSIYRQRLRELGFNRGDKVDQHGLMTALEEHYGTKVLGRIDYAYAQGRNKNWLRLCNATGVKEVPIHRHLVLAEFLFGRGERFWAFADSIQEPPLLTAKANRRRHAALPVEEQRAPTKESITKEQQKILQEIEKNPSWTLDDLWRERAGALRRLLKKQRKEGLAWLNNLLKKPVLVNKATVSPDDELWATRFRDTANSHYQSTDWPEKLTCSRILRRTNWKGGGKPDAEKYPQAREMLESLAESSWHFYARRILWGVFHYGPVQIAPFRIAEFVKVEDRRGKDLIKFFSAIKPTPPLPAGRIMQILRECGIKNDWEGLPNQKGYYTTGRGYQLRPRNKGPLARHQPPPSAM